MKSQVLLLSTKSTTFKVHFNCVAMRNKVVKYNYINIMRRFVQRILYDQIGTKRQIENPRKRKAEKITAFPSD